MATARVIHQSIPPSRKRYEAAHPTASVRGDRDLLNPLKRLKKTAGLSTADVLKIGLDKAQPAVEAAFNEGCEAGFAEAYEVAHAEYAVTYSCSRCHKRHMTITSDEEKEAPAKLMYQAGRHNPKCPVLPA